ncbi:uncharacterized protein TNCV_3714331 [Trichonephila clavipes]|nr:uncharacterized protein TNCV_3714331 [Trichonephila clavipes]
MIAPFFDVDFSTACLGTVRKPFFLFSSRTPGQHPGPKLRYPPFPLSENDQPSSFRSFLSFFSPFAQGSPFLPSHAFSLVGPYESILEPQLIRAHWCRIRQSFSPLVSSKTNRCPTVKPLRPTVFVLPPLMTIRHCVCKATVSCLGSNLVQSSMARLLYVQSHWHQSPNSK